MAFTLNTNSDVSHVFLYSVLQCTNPVVLDCLLNHCYEYVIGHLCIILLLFYDFYNRLSTPVLTGSGSMCVSFAYHMYGLGMGELRVEGWYQGQVEVIWSAESNHGDIWRTAQFDVDVNTGTADQVTRKLLNNIFLLFCNLLILAGVWV